MQAWCCRRRLGLGRLARSLAARPGMGPAGQRALRRTAAHRGGSPSARPACCPNHVCLAPSPSPAGCSPRPTARCRRGAGVGSLSRRPSLPVFSLLSPRPPARLGSRVTSGGRAESFRSHDSDRLCGLGERESRKRARTGPRTSKPQGEYRGLRGAGFASQGPSEPWAALDTDGGRRSERAFISSLEIRVSNNCTEGPPFLPHSHPMAPEKSSFVWAQGETPGIHSNQKQKRK